MSKTTLEKLGWKPEFASNIFECPVGVRTLFSGVDFSDADQLQWQLRFVIDARAVALCAPSVSRSYVRGGHLWLAYPKLSGSIRTDLSRDKGWEQISQLDLLPVTQIAIDSNWSALRFRYRTEIKKLTRRR